MIKTKQELLNHFSDINEMYNNPFMYQTLSNMIDELLEQQSSYNSIKTELDHVIDEIIIRIEQTRDKDKLCEYPYNRCIDIVREVLGNEV